MSADWGPADKHGLQRLNYTLSDTERQVRKLIKGAVDCYLQVPYETHAIYVGISRITNWHKTAEEAWSEALAHCLEQALTK